MIIDKLTFEILVYVSVGVSALTPVIFLILLFVDWKKGRLW